MTSATMGRAREASRGEGYSMVVALWGLCAYGSRDNVAS